MLNALQGVVTAKTRHLDPIY